MKRKKQPNTPRIYRGGGNKLTTIDDLRDAALATLREKLERPSESKRERDSETGRPR